MDLVVLLAAMGLSDQRETKTRSTIVTCPQCSNRFRSRRSKCPRCGKANGLSFKRFRLGFIIFAVGAVAIWLLIRLTTHEGLWKSDPDFHPFTAPTPTPQPDPTFGRAP